jgi:hypothetical protein
LILTTAWQTNGSALQTGLPTGLSCLPITTSTNTRTWTISGLPQLAPGNYLIHFAVGDGAAATNSINVPLLVNPEDARATFTGNPLVATSSSSSNWATVTLSATIRDISAVTTDPATDSTAGDIRNAKVTFVNRADNSVIASNLPVGLVSSSDAKTGTATCQWNVNLGTSSSQTFTVGIVVSGFYTRNSPTDDTAITVTRPLSGSSATGSGYLVLSRPAGCLSPDVGSKTDFAFSATNTSSGIKGSMSLVIRSGKHVYQVNALQLTTLSINGGHGTLNSLGQVIDVTVAKSPVLLDSTAMCQLQFTDNGSPGGNDTLAMTVWNGKGGLWFASCWDGTKTLEQKLGGGNLQVSSPGTSSLVTESDTEPLSLSFVLLPASKDRPARCQIQFPVVADIDHIVECSSDLQNWSQLKTIRFSTNQSCVLEEELTTGQRFYRVLRRSPAVPADDAHSPLESAR